MEKIQNESLLSLRFLTLNLPQKGGGMMDNLKSIVKLFIGAFSIGVGAYLLLASGSGSLFGDTASDDASNREVVKRIEEQENVSKARAEEAASQKRAVDEAFAASRARHAEQKAMIDREMRAEGGISARYDNAINSAMEEQKERYESALSASSEQRDAFNRHRASIAE